MLYLQGALDSSMHMLSVCIDFPYLPVYLCKNDGLGKWCLAICLYYIQSCVFIVLACFGSVFMPVNERAI